jgi:RimJ/RimL family protein N-acetyltransferase
VDLSQLDLTEVRIREQLVSMDALCIPILETERLRLRSLRAGDIDDYAAMYADREVLRYLGGGPEPWDRGRSWRHMAFQMGHWHLTGVGLWAVELRESGVFVGMIGFAAPECWPGFELAWTLARRFWSHGYATEGARGALAHAFNGLKKDRIISLIHPENRASIRVAERIGERLQDRINHLGREMLCYGLDRETYLLEVAPTSLRLKAGERLRHRPSDDLLDLPLEG